MKLTQKLALTMAAAMIVTAAPVVTMADSTNRVTSASKVIAKGERTTVSIIIDFKDHEANTDEEFFIELTGAKFTGDLGCVTKQEDKVAKVVVTDSDMTNNKVILKLPIEITDNGPVKAKLTAQGGTSTITEGEYVIATASDTAATLTLGDDKAFYDNGELNKITIKESYLEALNKLNKDADGNGEGTAVVKIELDDTDFEFVEGAVTVKGKYGFSGATITGTLAQAQNDASTALITLTGIPAASSLGTLEITGVNVKNNEKEISLGDLTASISLVEDTVSSDNKLDKSYDKQVVAKITNFGAELEMNDSKAVEVVAGRKAEMKFKVKETIKDSLTKGRKVEVRLDSEDAYFLLPSNTVAVTDVISDGDKFVASVDVIWADEKEAKLGNDLRAKGFDITVKQLSQGDNGYDEKVEFQVKSDVYVPVSSKDKTEVKLTAETRGVDKIDAVSAVTIKKPFDFDFAPTTLKVGLQGQEVGTFSIKETEAAMLQKGNLDFELVKGDNLVWQLSIDEIGNIDDSVEIKKAEANDKTTGQGIRVELNRESKAASTVTVKGMKVTADRTVPEGSYDLRISGSAVDGVANVGDKVNKLVIKDFIQIGTKNTQDMEESNGLAKTESVFTIGANKYTVNGVEKEMDATPYIQDGGYTMVPVRYVADALGVSGNNIMVSGNQVTIFAGNRTVVLKNGSNVAVVNSVEIPMATKVVIKEGRTYVPVAEIGRILGVSAVWDNETKTATFKN